MNKAVLAFVPALLTLLASGRGSALRRQPLKQKKIGRIGFALGKPSAVDGSRFEYGVYRRDTYIVSDYIAFEHEGTRLSDGTSVGLPRSMHRVLYHLSDDGDVEGIDGKKVEMTHVHFFDPDDAPYVKVTSGSPLRRAPMMKGYWVRLYQTWDEPVGSRFSFFFEDLGHAEREFAGLHDDTMLSLYAYDVKSDRVLDVTGDGAVKKFAVAYFDAMKRNGRDLPQWKELRKMSVESLIKSWGSKTVDDLLGSVVSIAVLEHDYDWVRFERDVKDQVISWWYLGRQKLTAADKVSGSALRRAPMRQVEQQEWDEPKAMSVYFWTKNPAVAVPLVESYIIDRGYEGAVEDTTDDNEFYLEIFNTKGVEPGVLFSRSVKPFFEELNRKNPGLISQFVLQRGSTLRRQPMHPQAPRPLGVIGAAISNVKVRKFGEYRERKIQIHYRIERRRSYGGEVIVFTTHHAELVDGTTIPIDKAEHFFGRNGQPLIPVDLDLASIEWYDPNDTPYIKV